VNFVLCVFLVLTTLCNSDRSRSFAGRYNDRAKKNAMTATGARDEGLKYNVYSPKMIDNEAPALSKEWKNTDQKNRKRMESRKRY
jgi:hypothetical protein